MADNETVGKNRKYVLDDIDCEILIALQEDSNLNIKELSERIHLSKTPIYKRISQLEEEGYIRKYVALVDRNKVDRSLIVFCSVSLSVQNADNINRFYAAIAKIDEITECYLTGGVNDFILKIIVKDLEHYNDVAQNKIARIPNVGKISSSFVLMEVKNTTAIPL